MFHVPNQGAAAPGTCVPEQTGGEPKEQLLSSYAGLRQRSSLKDQGGLGWSKIFWFAGAICWLVCFQEDSQVLLTE